MRKYGIILLLLAVAGGTAVYYFTGDRAAAQSAVQAEARASQAPELGRFGLEPLDEDEEADSPDEAATSANAAGTVVVRINGRPVVVGAGAMGRASWRGAQRQWTFVQDKVLPALAGSDLRTPSTAAAALQARVQSYIAEQWPQVRMRPYLAPHQETVSLTVAGRPARFLVDVEPGAPGTGSPFTVTVDPLDERSGDANAR